jgi:hypothetical protein
MLLHTHLNICVEGPRANKVPVRMEVDGSDAGLVAGEGTHNLGGLQVPYFEGAALGPCAHQLLGPAETHALDACRVARQRLQCTRNKY